MKPIEELNFTDDFVFGWMMLTSRKIVRGILYRILHIKVEKIIYNASQKTVKSFANSKGVRFDFCMEGDERIIEVEMQVKPDKNILRRSRFYEAAIDMDQLKAGKDYCILKDTYVVFICLEDPIGKGKSIYTIKWICTEDPNANVDNGVHEVYVNASAWEKEEDVALRALLRYIYTGQASDDFTQTLHKEVQMEKAREKFAKIYVGVGSPVDLAMEEGMAKGVAKGVTKTARAMLSERLPITTIVRCTGLTQDEVLALQQKA